MYATLRGNRRDREEQYLYEKTTPVGFEPTRGDPIGLAGRRLNRSAKVSLVRSMMKIDTLDVARLSRERGRVVMQRHVLQQELRAQCRNGGFECGLLLSD